MAVSQKERVFKEWLQAMSVVTYDNCREKISVGKRVVRREKKDADARWG